MFVAIVFASENGGEVASNVVIFLEVTIRVWSIKYQV